jgi:hypothetical protein
MFLLNRTAVVLTARQSFLKGFTRMPLIKEQR